MSDSASSCPKCGAALTASDSRFCGRCGEVIAEPADRKTAPGLSDPAPGQMGRTRPGIAEASAGPGGAPGKKTKPGISEPPAGEKGRTNPGVVPGADRPQSFGKTMLGIPGVVPPSASSGEGGGGDKPAYTEKGTMLDMSAVSQAAQAAGGGGPSGEDGAVGGENAGDSPPQGQPPKRFAKTMLGVADEVPTRQAAYTEKGTMLDMSAASQVARDNAPAKRQGGGFDSTAPGVAPEADHGGDGAAAPQGQGPAKGRTMLGMPAADLEAVRARQAARAADKAGGTDAAGAGGGAAQMAGKSGRTMLGVGMQGAAPSDPAPAQEPVARATKPRQRVRDDRAAPANQSSAYSDSSLPPPPRRGLSPVLLAVIALLLVCAGALLYLAFAGGAGGGGVQARVVRGEAGGERMQFEVPGAPQGTKLRFGGQERELEAGRAEFPLSVDSLQVGDNAVLAEVIKPDGTIDSARVVLSVDYRVIVDTAPLNAGEAKVDVVVSAKPGSRVLLDGSEVELGERGRAVRSDPLDLGESAKSGKIEHVVRYRIEPPQGEPSVGEVTTSIPVTTMQIDKPGSELVTDQSQVDIAGAVPSGTRVEIDGEEIPVTDGRFLHSYPLPKPGEYQPRVEARLDGKAPNVAVLTLRRVEDLAKAAAGFQADPKLTYAKIAQNPSIYRGQKVAFEARIYNIKVEAGRSVLQVLVRKCPKGKACSLWVTYPAATDFTAQSWVRVLGTVAGEQQFRSEQDQVQSVPKVEAAFLLPARL